MKDQADEFRQKEKILEVQKEEIIQTYKKQEE